MKRKVSAPAKVPIFATVTEKARSISPSRRSTSVDELRSLQWKKVQLMPWPKKPLNLTEGVFMVRKRANNTISSGVHSAHVVNGMKIRITFTNFKFWIRFWQSSRWIIMNLASHLVILVLL